MASVTSGAISFAPLALSSARAAGTAFPASSFPIDFVPSSSGSCSLASLATSFTVVADKGGAAARASFAFVAAQEEFTSPAHITDGAGFPYRDNSAVVEFHLYPKADFGISNFVDIVQGLPQYGRNMFAVPIDMGSGQPFYVWIDFVSGTLYVFVSQVRRKPTQPIAEVPWMSLCGVLRPRSVYSLHENFHFGFSAQSSSQAAQISILDWCLATGECEPRADAGTQPH